MCKLAFPDCQVLIHTTDWSEWRVGSWTQKTENEATDDPLLIHWIHLNLTGHLITRITPLLRLVLSSLPVIYGEQDLVFLKETEHTHLEMNSILTFLGGKKRRRHKGEIYAWFDPGQWVLAPQTALGIPRCISLMTVSSSHLVLFSFVCCHPLSLSLHYVLQDFLL